MAKRLTRWFFILPVLLSTFICLPLNNQAAAQASGTPTGVATSQSGQPLKDGPVRMKITTKDGKGTFAPVIKVSPEDAEKIRQLRDSRGSAQQGGR